MANRITKEQNSRALDIINDGLAKIIKNYSENALLINACFISIDKYRIDTNYTKLSTIQNIPHELRLDNEIDVQYTRNDLINNYSFEVPNRVAQNYFISSIAIIDAVLENLYEYFLKIENPLITEKEVDSLIRNAWTNDNMISFFNASDKANLQRPSDLETEFLEAFMRYLELRIVRHSILHTNGKLSDKNFLKLQKYLEDTPQIRKKSSILHSSIISQQNTISLTMVHILIIRQYLDRFLMYLYRSIEQRAVS